MLVHNENTKRNPSTYIANSFNRNKWTSLCICWVFFYMILSKNIIVTINSYTFKHYSLLGYKDLKVGKVLLIPIEHLSYGSGAAIKVKCDRCNSEKEMKYQNYIKNISNSNFYACSRLCGQDKVTKTNIEKYGCKTPLQLDSVKNKIRASKLKKYGNETFTNPKKRDETTLRKYGVIGYNNREKCRKTKISNHGNPSYTNREKAENTMLDKYGSKYANHVTEIFIKQQKNAFLSKLHEKSGLYYRGKNERFFLDYCAGKFTPMNFVQNADVQNTLEPET